MKKTLSQAIALAATLGAAASAHAVNVNADGHGQVLLYPVYTTESGNDTYIHVTNTQDAYKAVKVRFLEGMNSQEVLDFNLYLSPYDVWTGVIVRSDAGAKLISADTSCTAPAIPAGGVEFRNFQYQGTSYPDGKGGPQGTDRTRVGHLEIIEMGEVDPTFNLGGGVLAGTAIKHVAGVPGNCSAVRAAWQAPAGVWALNPNNGITVPNGGLYGVGVVINVDKGTEIGFDATAIDNFWAALASGHTAPGSLLPSLAQAQDIATFKNGLVAGFDSGIEAISAVLMKESIQNDYAHGAGLNAETDWVVTFPTKSFFVNDAVAADAPFTTLWTNAAVGGVAGSACETIGISYFDREEGEEAPSDLDFSPQPPSGPALALCWETNILSINGSDVLGGTYVSNNLNLSAGFQTGWINIDFTGVGRQLEGVDAADGVTPVFVDGLPVIGFSMVRIQNGATLGGLLANYAGSWVHKAVTSQDILAP